MKAAGVRPAAGGPVLAADATGAGPAAGAAVISVRQAVPSDRDELARMFARCTLETRYRRFHAPVKAIPGRYLAEALSGSPFHYALVACPEPAVAAMADADRIAGADSAVGAEGGTSPGGIAALASCRLVDEGAAELGLLVEDAWQRRGLGARLLGDLVAHANAAGLRVLRAQLLAEQAWIAGLLRPYGVGRLDSTWGGVLNVTVRLGA